NPSPLPATGILGWRDTSRALVCRRVEEVAYTAASGATGRVLVPDSLRRDGAASADHLGPSAAQREWARRREVGVSFPVRLSTKLGQLVWVLIACPRVAGGATDRHPQGGGRLERLIE